METVPQLDTSDPNSLISRLPDKARQVFLSVPPIEFEKTEQQLIREAFDSHKPNETYARLKINIWAEYRRVKPILGKLMSTAFIYKGVCSPHHFYKVMSKDKACLAYLLSEPIEYTTEAEEILNAGTPEMLRIMNLPDQVNQKTGLVDVSLLALKFKIWQHMEARIQGAITQKFEMNQKNLNLNADITPSSVPSIDQFNSLEEIEAKIKELEKPRQASLPAMRDVLPTDYIEIKSSRGQPIETLNSPELLNHGRPIKGGS